jgi:hypothetical protein
MVVHLLSNYFKGHVIVCVNMYNTVYGLDFVGAHNNIPINKNTVLHIHSNPYLRLYPIDVYLHDTLQAFQSEITIYKKKKTCVTQEAIQTLTRRIAGACVFCTTSEPCTCSMLPPRRSDYIFRVCATVPTGSPPKQTQLCPICVTCVVLYSQYSPSVVLARTSVTETIRAYA